MNVEDGAYQLLIVAAVGVALVILTGVGYTNYANAQAAMTASGATAGIKTNFTTNAGAIVNTQGSNSNYVYYILFMALVIAVVIGALVGAVRRSTPG